MSEKKKSRVARGLFVVVKKVFFLGCLLIAVFAVVGYAAGWVTFEHDESQRKAVIEVHTGKIEDVADEAVEEGSDALEQTGESLQSVGEDDTASDES